MFRLFCVAALLGYFFGSSKRGKELREQVDGFMNELVSDDTKGKLEEKKNNLSEMANRSLAFFKPKNGDASHGEDGDGKRTNGSNRKENSKKTKAENNEQESESSAEDVNQDQAKELDAEKAQELADKLGAKPVAPEDENLAAYHHSDDELKSA